MYSLKLYPLNPDALKLYSGDCPDIPPLLCRIAAIYFPGQQSCCPEIFSRKACKSVHPSRGPAESCPPPGHPRRYCRVLRQQVPQVVFRVPPRRIFCAKKHQRCPQRTALHVPSARVKGFRSHWKSWHHKMPFPPLSADIPDS